MTARGTTTQGTAAQGVTALGALRGAVAVVGVGHAGLGQANGFTDMEILVQAAHRAVSDAGLTLQDIDGICTASVTAPMWIMPVIEHLGIRPRFIDSTMLGGSSFVAHLLPAMHALATGQCNAVLVCYGSTQRTSSLNRAEIARVRKSFDPQPYEAPYEPLNPLSSYALAAARHMHQYGTRREDLAEVALAANKWAQLNPEAQQRTPTTLDEILSARMISDPLSVRDCCLVTDGAGAFVLTRADRARDLARPPVYVLGNATAVWNRQISSMDDLTVTAATQSGAAAFRMAGMSAADVDVAEMYDAFTINTLLFLEDLGFCKKGEAGDFVRGGAIAPGGRLPVNTNGGGLCCIHPGMYGVFIMIEAVRQLRAECGARQVDGAEVALVHGNGGTLSSQSTAILGTAATL
jgi:acetyl-CoA acetyltransferase